MKKSEKQTSCVLVDWGTSSLRLWRVDQERNVLAEHRSSLGMRTLAPAEFEPTLEKILAELNVSIEIPVLVCGMAGAQQGWMDAGYIDLPAKLDCLADNVVIVRTNSGRDVRIVPGMAQRDVSKPDVMRGEETILQGALLSGIPEHVFCLPGTHSKWVKFDDSHIRSFSTFMSGELFALISDHSTLSALIKPETEALDKTGFLSGFSETITSPNNLTQSLFSLRAGPLLGGENDAVFLSSRLSGMLIAAEIASVRNEISGPVGLIASGAHKKIYELAFKAAEIAYSIYDSEELVLLGLAHVANQIWGNQ